MLVAIRVGLPPLLDLSEESGTDQIEKSLTHQTIAQMIGASRETVSRAMKDFQDAGWITVDAPFF